MLECSKESVFIRGGKHDHFVSPVESCPMAETSSNSDAVLKIMPPTMPSTFRFYASMLRPRSSVKDWRITCRREWIFFSGLASSSAFSTFGPDTPQRTTTSPSPWVWISKQIQTFCVFIAASMAIRLVIALHLPIFQYAIHSRTREC